MPRGKSSVDGHKAKDFGADRINVSRNWNGSGYDHYTAYSETGGQVSWNEAAADNSRDVVDEHMTDQNA